LLLSLSPCLYPSKSYFLTWTMVLCHSCLRSLSHIVYLEVMFCTYSKFLFLYSLLAIQQSQITKNTIWKKKKKGMAWGRENSQCGWGKYCLFDSSFYLSFTLNLLAHFDDRFYGRFGHMKGEGITRKLWWEIGNEWFGYLSITIK
jgi:hypothetical protein